MQKLRWKIAQAAEIRWWQSYLRRKPKKDYLRWKKDYWERFLDQTGLQLQKQDRVLDAGCGPAGLFTILEEQEVDAVDPLLAEYEDKLDHFSRADYPWTKFHGEKLENYDPPRRYDVVFCLNAINHVSDLHQSFDQLVKLTKPGGRLVVSIDAHNYSFFKSIFRLLPGDILHPHQFDLQEYKSMLTERGCPVDKVVQMDRSFLFDYYILVAQKASSAH